jgi:phosphoribosylaminoimidazole-succinocarboxamide synthase
MRGEIVLQTDFPELKLVKRGKVRDIYALGNYLLMVATDRISVFDVVLPDGIPGKGFVLTQISKFWFEMIEEIIPNHLVSTDLKDYPEACLPYEEILSGRSMLVRQASPMPVECIVRGYLSGSAWSEYREDGSVCGIKLPDGLVQSSRLEEPLFTPSTKAEQGAHDENISCEMMREIVGSERAERLESASLAIYEKARTIAEEKGVIIADTKFEFGLCNDQLMLIDELLTPDSSRFWLKEKYRPGEGQQSLDKQYVRDYLSSLSWNKEPPAPPLPYNVVEQTAKRYREILEILTS